MTDLLALEPLWPTVDGPYTWRDQHHDFTVIASLPEGERFLRCLVHLCEAKRPPQPEAPLHVLAAFVAKMHLLHELRRALMPKA